MIVSASTLARCITLGTLVDAIRGCLGAFIIWDGLRILGRIGRLSIAADAAVAQGVLERTQSAYLEDEVLTVVKISDQFGACSCDEHLYDDIEQIMKVERTASQVLDSVPAVVLGNCKQRSGQEAF